MIRYFLILTLLSGCAGPATEQPRYVDTSIVATVGAQQPESEEAIPDLYLDLDGILVVFDSLGEFMEENLSKGDDTVSHYLELGSYPKAFSFKSGSYTVLEVSQSYRTTMSIQNEGPHCELEGWKHFESPWVKLDLKQQGDQMHAQSWDPPDDAHKKFPGYTYTELIAHVEEHCGPEWASGLRLWDSIGDNYESVDHESLGSSFYRSPGISDYFYRIKALGNSGDTVTKYIRLIFPMGC